MAISPISRVFSVGAAAVLALSACAAPAVQAGASSTVQPSSTAVAQPTAAATTPAPPKLHTEAELTGILSSLKNAQGVAPSLIPAAELAQGTTLQKEALEAVEISPEQCRVFAATNAELPAGSVYAAGNWSDEVEGNTVLVTLIAMPAQELAAASARAKAVPPECSEFTMTVAGQSIKTTVTAMPVETSDSNAGAAMVTQNLPDGTVVNMATVHASQDGLAIVVAQLGPDVSAGSVAELGTLANQVLDAA